MLLLGTSPPMGRCLGNNYCAYDSSYPVDGVGKRVPTTIDGSDQVLQDVLFVLGTKKNLSSLSSFALRAVTFEGTN